ncbi:sugar phosphate nucleotidyltransferase [Halopiger aswanensis]|uniref:Bifunctional protein GlmU n=1 Tax=Halopiger aswanensis TaxID=148449 RepID=A0A419WRK4_9EURY|nr:sugar phosphate nucleotidyltransferase [Halopiger aswanensis]RKD98046.1 glucose-1-phosphate thymidylyltransferase [Halopiger aswanensis]
MSEANVPAVVLAAGEGRRLDPLTNRRPKPMVPVANRPILEYVISAIADAGIDRVVLIVGYRDERIRNHFGDGDDWDIDIEYVVQETQLGTAHAVLQAESAVDGPFLVLNGDRIVDSSLVERVRDEIVDADTSPVMSVTRTGHASDYGVVSLEGNRIVDITEKPTEPVRSEVINAGVYGFDGAIFDAIRETPTEHGEMAITTTLETIASEEPIRAIRYRDVWLDVSYLWDLLNVNAAVIDEFDDSGAELDGAIAADTTIGENISLGANATLGGSVAIGDNVTIEANAVVSNAVVFSDAVIEAGAVVRDAIVAENARIGANATIAGGESTVVVADEVHEDVELGGVVGDNATVGGGTVLDPGTVLGDGAVVDPGATVSGRIESDAIVRRG